jgi:hypothetical protein
MARGGIPPFLMHAMAEAQADDAPVLPMMEAQREKLADLLVNTSHAFKYKRGDFVHYPPGYGPMKKELRTKLLLMFWRYIEPETNFEDASRVEGAEEALAITLPTIDCMIVNFDGRDIQFHLACAAMLQPGSAQP